MSSTAADQSLFPHHLYQKQAEGSTSLLLDESLHDKHLPKLEQAKMALKIGDDTTFATPIEQFGSKILANFGWKEGYGVGKDMDKQSAPIEYIPRQYRLGLGAKALTADQVTNKRQLTVTENYQASSIGKNIKRVGEELKQKQEMTVGSKVVVMQGSHQGLQGEIIAMKKQSALGQDQNSDLYVSVMLEKSGATVEIKLKRLQLKRDRSRSPQKTEQRQAVFQTEGEGRQRSLKWIREGILVRCVSKACYDGRLYGKELVVTAVLSRFEFEAKCDSRIYTELREKDLETVLPSSSQLAQEKRVNVVILRGSHQGKQAKVLGIDKKRDIVDVQIEYIKVIQVSQDDVSIVAEEE